MKHGWLVLGFVAGILLVGGAAALGSGEPVSGEVVLGAPNGPNVSVDGASEIELTDPFIDAQTVDLTTNAGNATLSSQGQTNVSVKASEIEGTWTNLTELDVSTAPLSVDPNDKPEFAVGGAVSLLNVSDNVAVGDGSPDFVIEGSGTGNVTVQTSTIGETVFAVNESGTVLDSATTDASGEVTFDSLSLSKHTVSIRLGTGPKLSNLQPSGLQPDSTPTEMSVDIEYPEFQNGNQVDVEFVLDGSTVNTQTIGANTTVTEPMPSRGQTAGEHDLEVIATDTTTGDVTQIDTTYKLPDSVFIRNETMPNQNITNVNVTMTSLGENDVVRNFSGLNGEINLTGLPADRPLLIRLQADQFYNRTVFLDNVFEQQRVYMLNESFNSNTVRYVIDDRSGLYPPDSSEILVNRILDVNGSVQYERVSGDFAAVDGHTAIIKDGERYQIAVRNDDGDLRVVGGYDSLTDETVELTIGEVKISPDPGQAFTSNGTYDNATSPPQVVFEFVDDTQETDAINVTIYELNNQSRTVLAQDYTGPFGELRVTQPISQSVADNVSAWVVEYEIERDGEITTGKHVVGPQAPVNPGLSQFWQSFVGVVGLVVVAGLFGGIRAELGAIAVPLVAGMLWFIGFLPAAVGAGAILLALVVGVLYYTASPRGAPTR